MKPFNFLSLLFIIALTMCDMPACPVHEGFCEEHAINESQESLPFPSQSIVGALSIQEAHEDGRIPKATIPFKNRSKKIKKVKKIMKEKRI